jgi:hypothetical protein
MTPTPGQGTPLPELMTRREVADHLRCSTKTVQRRFPSVKIGHLVRYRREVILAAINQGASQ